VLWLGLGLRLGLLFLLGLWYVCFGMMVMDRVRFSVRVQVTFIAIFLIRHRAGLGLGLGLVLGLGLEIDLLLF
jgi:hypothetical protein